MKKKPNVILITIDSLRADHLGYMGYEKNTSPNIDALAKESVVFTNAYSNGPMTAQSLISLSTSTYPLDYNGPRKVERPRMLISEVFKKEGYITAVFTSNAYISDFFGYDRGWDFFEYFSLPLLESKEKRIKKILKAVLKEISFLLFPHFFFWIKYLKYKKERKKSNFSEAKFWRKPPDSLLTQALKDFINSTKEVDFFSWIHYGGVHSPFLPLKSYLYGSPLSFSEIIAISLHENFSIYSKRKALKKVLKKNFKKIKELYDQAIQYVDLQIKDLLNFLKKEKLYENTIIILTADHGEEFLGHGKLGHYSQLYNELLHVPLILKIPGEGYKKIDKKVSLVDLAPTLCEILAITPPPSFKGKSFFTQKSNPFLFHQTAFNEKKEGPFKYTEIESIKQCKIACQNEEWKYLLNYDTQKEELYNLIQDPKEQNNLFHKEQEVLFKMRKMIQEFESKNPPLSFINKNCEKTN